MLEIKMSSPLEYMLKLKPSNEYFNNFISNNSCSAIGNLLENTFVVLDDLKNLHLDNVKVHLFNITTVLDKCRELLHTGVWAVVPNDTKKLYTFAVYIKICILMCLYENEYSELEKNNIILDALQISDISLMMGADLDRNENLIRSCITKLSSLLRRETLYNSNHPIVLVTEQEEYNIKNEYKNIAVLHCPSIEHFRVEHFVKEKPVILKDCITHWPAITKWRDISYILQTCGERVVPIELGAKYTDSTWSQKLMTVENFFMDYVIEQKDCFPVGYLAQHQLLDQVPQLRDDIIIPDYCCLSSSENTNVDINAWFGPSHTISPTHYDPKHNFLAQIMGVKTIKLFAPEDSKYLYPFVDVLLKNSAQVDPCNPDLAKYPEYINAKSINCTLKSGDILYIPPKWWHHITSLTTSFSVSFWWE